MDEQSTPKSHIQCKSPLESYFNVPPTPHLKQIGYGTGVSIYHLERSPKIGVAQSPWALKKINKNAKQCDSYAERLRKEGEILKTLNHPNIVGFRGFTDSEDGRQVLALEECTYSVGDLIENYIEMGLKSFEPHLIYRVIGGITKALEYLHTEKKLLHGDIKSYNILIKGNFEEVKLCDFGVSLELNERGEVENEIYIGTLSWSPPEALYGGPITTKADVFSLGLVIWEMIALCPPHAESFSGTMSDLEESFSNSEKNFGTRPKLPDVPLGHEYSLIIDIFKWCTEEDVKKRPSAKELHHFLKLKGIEED